MSMGGMPFLQGGVHYRLRRLCLGARRFGGRPEAAGGALFGGGTHRWVAVEPNHGSAIVHRLLLDCDPLRLRQLLDPDDHEPWRMSDVQVRQRVHQQWRENRIELHRGEPLAQPEAQTQERGAWTTGGTPAVTPSMLREQAQDAPPPRPALPVYPAMEPSLQAQALVQAARHGLALCEMCERAAA